jgi:acyl dehydratase
MIQPDLVRAFRSEVVTQSYDAKEAMLYALAVGAGADPADRTFVYEKALKALPTFAVTLGREKPWLTDPQYGLNLTKMLAAGQSTEIHRPLSPAATIKSQMTVEALHDKGEGRGAIMTMKRALSDAESGEPIADVRITVLLRGDGGFGGQSDPVADPHVLPDRSPDQIDAYQTSPDQAVLYRLASGDYNPIHIDESVSSAAGLPGPILHGLCTYGVACRHVLRAACDDDPAAIRRFDARFTSPVYPGDLIVTEIWKDGDTVSFRCRVPERKAVVLSNGFAQLR